VKNLLLCEIFVVEGKMIVEISVNFRSFHSENTTGLSGQERSFLISTFFFLIRGLLTFFMATQRTVPDGRINVRHKIDRKLCRSRNPLSPGLRRWL
jgi:hypothetical protein